MLHAEKMEAVGTLAGGIAHDFNNILSALTGYTDLAKESVTPDSEAYEHLTEIGIAGTRASDLVSQILTFSRQGSPERKLLKIEPILEEALNLLRNAIPSTVALTRDIHSDCGTVLANATQVHQVECLRLLFAQHIMVKQVS